jgi:hypothetical protein
MQTPLLWSCLYLEDQCEQGYTIPMIPFMGIIYDLIGCDKSLYSRIMGALTEQMVVYTTGFDNETSMTLDTVVKTITVPSRFRFFGTIDDLDGIYRLKIGSPIYKKSEPDTLVSFSELFATVIKPVVIDYVDFGRIKPMVFTVYPEGNCYCIAVSRVNRCEEFVMKLFTTHRENLNTYYVN